MRIGFLFNHDQAHQVAHALPIAMALARGGTGAEIVIATTGERLAGEVLRLCGGTLPEGLSHVGLKLSGVSKAIAGLVDPVAPASKLLIYRDNLDFFRSLDILVVTEKTSLILKTRFGLEDLKLVHTRHGAGDRAIGFDRASAGFDHVLCSGHKIKDRLIDEAAIDPERISIVGYPKFDIAPQGKVPFAGAPGDRPVVLYNPHPSPHLSSWFRHGRAVLDFFLDNDEYRLIFAPHVMLFARRLVITIDKLRVDSPGKIDEKYLRSPNIHVDTGGPSSLDMTYTNCADIYLGDVSSQIYEFLKEPRPCLFLNSHGADYANDPNYAHWRAGPVIERPLELGEGLKRAVETHAGEYAHVQRELFAYSFDLAETPSSARAAAVIAGLSAKWRQGVFRSSGNRLIEENALNHGP
jgi:hypothetical protein